MTDAMRYALKVIRQNSYPYNDNLVPLPGADNRLRKIRLSTLAALRREGQIEVLDYPIDDDRFITKSRLSRGKTYHIRLITVI